MNKELIKEFMTVFPNVGANVGIMELKFRFGGKYGNDLETTLDGLVKSGIMTTYEFNGVNYKLAEEFPIGEAPKSGEQNGDMNSDLKNLLIAISNATKDANVIQMAKDFANKY